MNRNAMTVFLLAAALTARLAGPARADGDNFANKDLRMRNMSGKSLVKATFEDAMCFLTNFKDARLAGANFTNADVTSASFDGADLTGADFRGAVVTRASFQTANCSRSNFEGVDMGRGIFYSVDFRGANLKKTRNYYDLNKSDFRGADLRGANLRGAANADQARFQNAKYDRATLWPLGFDYENSGAVLTEAAADAPKQPARTAPTTKAPAGKVPAQNPAQEAPAPGTIEPVPAGGPPVATIKKALEKFWGPLGATTKHVYHYKSIRFAPPTKEVVTINGVGNFTGKVFYPVRVACDITVNFADGTTRMETRNQTFHFFLDNFKEWSFRFIPS